MRSAARAARGAAVPTGKSQQGRARQARRWETRRRRLPTPAPESHEVYWVANHPPCAVSSSSVPSSTMAADGTSRLAITAGRKSGSALGGHPPGTPVRSLIRGNPPAHRIERPRGCRRLPQPSAQRADAATSVDQVRQQRLIRASRPGERQRARAFRHERCQPAVFVPQSCPIYRWETQRLIELHDTDENPDTIVKPVSTDSGMNRTRTAPPLRAERILRTPHSSVSVASQPRPAGASSPFESRWRKNDASRPVVFVGPVMTYRLRPHRSAR